jgi:uncharacterized protein with FMN-binding domain
MDAGGTPVSGTGSGRADGVPEWAAEGHGGGVVTVDITLINGNITKALISGPNETPVIGGEAIDRASTSIPAKNTYNIDSMTGVTFTSDAIREAARLALIDAGVDPDLCPDS